MGQELTDQLQAYALYKGIKVLSVEAYPQLLQHTLAECKDLEKENEDLQNELEDLRARMKTTDELQGQLDEVTKIARRYKRKAKRNYKKQQAAEELLDYEVSRTKTAQAKFEIQRRAFLRTFEDLLTNTVILKYSELEDLVLKNVEDMRKIVDMYSPGRRKDKKELAEDAAQEEGLVEDLLRAAQGARAPVQDISLKAWEKIVGDTTGEVTSPTKKKKNPKSSPRPSPRSSPGPSSPVKKSSPKKTKSVVTI
ncbi:hypothetical protein R1sor_026647 [Riccia sorocarpa]|uniref:Uncharacterized protein n=1 Tax=Riccia sorocarpa TaxID=122646 RepID=A0ABD3GHP6_9MARC